MTTDKKEFAPCWTIEGEKSLTEFDDLRLFAFLGTIHGFKSGIDNMLVGYFNGSNTPIIVNKAKRYFKRGFQGKRKPLETLAIDAGMPGSDKFREFKGSIDFTQPVTLYPYYTEMFDIHNQHNKIISYKFRGVDFWGEKANRWVHKCNGEPIELNDEGIFPYSEDITWALPCESRCGCKKEDVSLYNIEGLYRSNPGSTIYWVEGEKDCDTLNRIGLTAICHYEGSGTDWKRKLSKKVTNYLKRRNVVILSDADNRGRAYSQWVAWYLANDVGVISVKVLNFIDKFNKAKRGFDVSDWLGYGGSKEQLLNAANRADDISSGLKLACAGVVTVGIE